MGEIKFVFVVLHYNEKSLNDTFECISSLEKISEKTNYKIIVVENGSKDNSAKKILDKYKNNSNVHCIISENNLGFANGNNLGCDFAREKYNPDYLIVLNNDTYILQENFLQILEDIYLKTNFDILGPYIYDKNLKPQNPVLDLKTKLEEVNSEILRVERILSSNIHKEKLKSTIKNILLSQEYLERIIRKILNKPKKMIIDELANKENKNVGLHGSCLIFSKNYMKKYINIFYNKTFMYVEEDILYNRVLRDKLKSVYSPNLKIYHKEDRSTEAIVGKKFEKQMFILKHIRDSLEIYREVLINGEQDWKLKEN